MDEQTRQLANAREREAATREILRVISRSPGNYEPVFETILNNAIRLCGAPFGSLLLVRGEHMHVVANAGLGPELLEFFQANPHPVNHPSSLLGQAAHDRTARQRVNLADDDGLHKNPRRNAALELGGIRTLLGVPIVQDDQTVGVIALWRQEVKPFSDDDIELVSTFADQAVIALENVRLFNETREALEQQKASAEVLSVVSNSVADAQPVFEKIVKSCERLFPGCRVGLNVIGEDGLVYMGAIGNFPGAEQFKNENFPHPASEESATGAAIKSGQVVHYPDVMGDPSVPEIARRGCEKMGLRSGIIAPLLLDGQGLGAIFAGHAVVHPFTDKEAALLKTFADQAVIAIQNARLFQALETRTTDLTQSLERQTATSEILRSISQSPTDYAPIFDTILKNAVRLCSAPFGTLFLLRDGALHVVADAGSEPAMVEHLRTHPIPLDETSSVLIRAVTARAPLQQDLLDEAYHAGDPRRRVAVDRFGCRTWLAVPLLKSGEVIGAIALYRKVAEPFADDDVALMSTFADQAVIAIENVRLFQALETRTTDLTKSLERQTATSEILRSISASPTDYQPVFDTILHNAARLCGAPFGTLLLLRDNHLHLVADVGSRSEFIERLRTNPLPLDHPFGASSRTARSRAPSQALDVKEEVYRTGDPVRIADWELGGVRTAFAVPLLKGDEAIGVITLYRQEVKPFADEDIELVRTFADQAVIAIENVRLFQALQGRTADLSKSLERQTATSEILRSISQSPTDYAPVFDTILENATHLCGAPFGMLYLLRDDHLHLVASVGARREYVEHIQAHPVALNNPIAATSRAAVERAPVQLADLTDEAHRSKDPTVMASVELEGIRTLCAVPMLKGGETIGVISLYRREVGAFEADDVALVSTFADQAVIAIENVRLFQALESRNSALGESLERQTATSEILRAISRSPTDYQPVFDTILESATRLCDAPLGQLYLIRDGGIHLVANRGSRPEFLQFSRDNVRPVNRTSGGIAKALSERRPMYTEDAKSEALYTDGDKWRVAMVELEGIRSVMIVPLLKGEDGIGVMILYRREVRSFEERHVSLLETFADQAVIAIENVRLFQALQGRTADLSKSLERQTATSEILRSISQSPTGYAPVFDTILENASRLCDVQFSGLLLLRDDHLYLDASLGGHKEFVDFYQANPVPLDTPEGVSAAARCARERTVQHDIDVRDSDSYRSGDKLRVAAVDLGGIRTLLMVPLFRDEETLGVLALFRQEVRAFGDDEIELVRTFADQAVIAIENVNLFNETNEALERQTASADILKVISSSPTDVQPVFDAIAQSVRKLCGGVVSGVFRFDGEQIQFVAQHGWTPEVLATFQQAYPRTPGEDKLIGRALLERRVINVADVLAEFRTVIGQAEMEHRGVLVVPLMREGVAIGAIAVARKVPGLFLDKQINLVTTFADQAVIAIENVRLFQALEGRTADLTKSLERQTATSEILRSISRSPTGYMPVFDTILKNASRLCDVRFAGLFLLRDDHLYLDASLGGSKEFVDVFRDNPIHLSTPEALSARCARERTVVHEVDLRKSDIYRAGYKLRVAAVEMGGIRTLLMVPLFRDEETLGVLSMYRQEVRAFEDEEIELVRTFADQAVIAIENVRMFQALEGRTMELTKTLERQTATSEILRSISRSPTDYAPVFDTILENATRLCEAPLGLLFLRRNDHLENVASIGAQPAFIEFLATHQVPLDENTTVGQAAQQKKAMQLEDTREASRRDSSSPARIATVELEGARTFLAVPMLRDEQVVGVIAIYRREVRRFDDSMVELLETFADQAVIAIENVRLFQTVESRSGELAQSVAELEALGDIAQAVSSSLDVDTVLDTIVTRAVQLSRADAGAINEFDEATGTLPFRAAPGMEHMLEQPAPRLGEGAVGRAAATRAPVQIADITVPGAYTGRLTDELAHLQIRALLAVPLMQNDRVLGTLVVARRTPGAFPPAAERLLRALGTQSAIAIRNARLFREIEDKGRELEAANRHKSEFLANMSHELRTPLNAVIGFSEVLGERMFGELNDKQAEYVTDIHDSGRHLLSLINDILDLSKIEAGAMELDLGRFALAPALENALTLVRERAERRGIDLQAQLDDGLGEMEGDERKLKQILLNLLSNAIKFTPAGGKVTLEARQDDAHVHIAVRDTGVGISEEDLAVIFEEFKQVGTDYARKVEGTGLGLTLTKRFVEMHGGHITVTSEPGEGSVFTVVLPLRAVEQAT